MAQAEVFSPIGALQVKANTPYTTVDVPTGVNVIVLNYAPIITAYLHDNEGKRVLDDNAKPIQRKTGIRGVRVIVAKSGVAYPKSNVPFIWEVGQEIIADTNATYTFLSECTVVYGIRTTP